MRVLVAHDPPNSPVLEVAGGAERRNTLNACTFIKHRNLLWPRSIKHWSVKDAFEYVYKEKQRISTPLECLQRISILLWLIVVLASFPDSQALIDVSPPFPRFSCQRAWGQLFLPESLHGEEAMVTLADKVIHI